MSKMTAVLSFSGDKSASRTLAIQSVQGAIVCAIAHGDKSYFADTLSALEGVRANVGKVVRATLSSLADSLAAMRGGLTESAPGVPSFEGFTLVEVTAKGKKSPTLLDAVNIWALGVSEQWMLSVESELSAIKDKAKAKATCKADKAAILAAKTDASENKGTQAAVVTVSRDIARVVTIKARAKTAAHLRGLRALVKNQAAQIAELQAQIEALQASTKKITRAKKQTTQLSLAA